MDNILTTICFPPCSACICCFAPISSFSSIKHFSHKMPRCVWRHCFNKFRGWAGEGGQSTTIKSQNWQKKRKKEREYCQVVGRTSLLCRNTHTHTHCNVTLKKLDIFFPELLFPLCALRRKLHISFVLAWLNTILPAAPCSCFFALCLMTPALSSATHARGRALPGRAERLK